MGEEVEELVKRLRSFADDVEAHARDAIDHPFDGTDQSYHDGCMEQAKLGRSAADTIESLRASLTRVEEERDALRQQFEPRDIDVERCAARLRQIVYGHDQKVNCTDLALAAWRTFFDGEWDFDAINNRVRFTPTRLSRAAVEPGKDGDSE